MFEKVLEELKDKSKGNLPAFDRLGKKRLLDQFDEVEGATLIPNNRMGAKISAGIRATQSMAKLGLAVLSSFSDIAMHAAELRYQGENLLQAWGRSLTASLEGMKRGEAREAADLIGVGLEGWMGDVMSRFTAVDSLPGIMTRAQQAFFKLTGLNWWTDSRKTALGLMMARRLGQLRERPWEGLEEPTRRLLRLYDVDGGKWELLRSVPTKEADGRFYLTPETVQMIPDSGVRAYMLAHKEGGSIQAWRDRLETSLRAYYTDRAQFATPTPGAKEHAIMMRGTRPGTIEGEALRFVMQFKSFPIAVITKALGREVYGHGAENLGEALFKGKGDLLGLVHLIVGTTAMGYLSIAAKDLAKGKTPRDPGELKTWQAAMIQGGGAGIYGDFLFGEFNRFGHHQLWSSALGPTAGVVEDVFDIWSRLKRGDDAAAQTFRAAVNNTPFVNLFYTRMALDYLILYQIQESLNPGYLRRMERRMEQENAQSFLIRPSQHIPYGGGSRLFEGVR